jgi:predicted metal-binding membrane protein
MVTASDAASHPRIGRAYLPLVVTMAAATAWAVMVLAWTEGWAGDFGHGHLIEHGPGIVPALGLFLCAWQVMVAAMMLPSSIPAFRWFGELTSARSDWGALDASFLGGVLLLWTGFGMLAFLGDDALHHLVHGWAWLGHRPWLIGGGVMVLVGAYTLSPLSARCRTEVGHVSGRRSHGRGLGPAQALWLGVDHGLRRLRRCWALMLLSFAIGMGSLVWMAALSTLMTLERSGSRSERIVLGGGVGLLLLGSLVLAHPSWLPQVLPVGA